MYLWTRVQSTILKQAAWLHYGQQNMVFKSALNLRSSTFRTPSCYLSSKDDILIEEVADFGDPKKEKEEGLTKDFNIGSSGQFHDEIIYDFDEEIKLKEAGLWNPLPKQKKHKEEFLYERGKEGVLDVHDLVQFIRQKRGRNIVVFSLPDELHYVSHIVIASGASARHLKSLSEQVQKLFKSLMHENERGVIVEGKTTQWVAMDMGNIALHLMSAHERMEKDLESLWTVGPEFDENCQGFESEDALSEWHQMNQSDKKIS